MKQQDLAVRFSVDGRKQRPRSSESGPSPPGAEQGKNMLDLTTSQLRCLLTVMDLSASGNAVASKEIAVQMRVSRPSVHRLLEGLAGRGLVDKEPYGAVELSEKGREEAKRLRELEKACAERMAGQFGLGASEAEKAALILICGLDGKSVCLIAGK